MKRELKDYLYTINQSKKNIMDEDGDAVKGYPPFIINKCLSSHPDAILFSNEMNIQNHLDKKMQYDFYLNSLKPRKRFAPWMRKNELENLELVKQYYGYNHSKAVAALRILTNSDLEEIKKLLDKGGLR
jgi:hypothetical protein